MECPADHDLYLGGSIVMPSATILMLDLFPRMRGMASSLQSFAQFALAGFTSGTIAPFLAVSVQALSLGMAGFTTASVVLWLVYQYRARAHLKRWQP